MIFMTRYYTLSNYFEVKIYSLLTVVIVSLLCHEFLFYIFFQKQVLSRKTLRACKMFKLSLCGNTCRYKQKHPGMAPGKAVTSGDISNCRKHKNRGFGDVVRESAVQKQTLKKCRSFWEYLWYFWQLMNEDKMVENKTKKWTDKSTNNVTAII